MESLELSELLKATILTQQVAFYVVSFTFLLTLTWCSSEEEGQPLPHISGMYFGGGGTGPPPHRATSYPDGG